MSFQINALDPAPFAPLFLLSDAELAAQGTVRMRVENYPGTPCRITLEDAEIGEEVLLTNYLHLPGNSPYRACHAIYIRRNKVQAVLPSGYVPDAILNRQMSLRAFDERNMMRTAALCPGDQVDETLIECFKDSNTAFVHLHYAAAGCFAATATPT